MTHLRLAVFCIVILFSASCDSGNDIEYSGGRSSLDMRVGAQLGIKEKLRDPDSAEFTNVRISRKSGIDIVCGEVNSRNGFGGMGGEQQFISNGATLSFLQEEVVDGGWPEIWNQYC